MRYKKGYRSITEKDITDILKNEGLASYNLIATLLNRHYFTVKRRCEELAEEGILNIRTYKSAKGYDMRLVELGCGENDKEKDD